MAICHSSMSSLVVPSICGLPAGRGTAPVSSWSAEQRGTDKCVSVLTHGCVYYHSVQSLQTYLQDRMNFKESGSLNLSRKEYLKSSWAYTTPFPLTSISLMFRVLFLTRTERRVCKSSFSIELSKEPCILLQCGCITLSKECKVINSFPRITLQLSTS